MEIQALILFFLFHCIEQSLRLVPAHLVGTLWLRLLLILLVGLILVLIILGFLILLIILWRILAVFLLLLILILFVLFLLLILLLLLIFILLLLILLFEQFLQAFQFPVGRVFGKSPRNQITCGGGVAMNI